MSEQGGRCPLPQMVQGVPDDCFGSISVIFVNDFPFFSRGLVLVLDRIFLFPWLDMSAR